MLTDQMNGFKKEHINYNSDKISFRHWLISEIDANRMSIQKARLSNYDLNTKKMDAEKLLLLLSSTLEEHQIKCSIKENTHT